MKLFSLFALPMLFTSRRSADLHAQLKSEIDKTMTHLNDDNVVRVLRDCFESVLTNSKDAEDCFKK